MNFDGIFLSELPREAKKKEKKSYVWFLLDRLVLTKFFCLATKIRAIFYCDYFPCNGSGLTIM